MKTSVGWKLIRNHFLTPNRNTCNSEDKRSLLFSSYRGKEFIAQLGISSVLPILNVRCRLLYAAVKLFALYVSSEMGLLMKINKDNHNKGSHMLDTLENSRKLVLFSFEPAIINAWYLAKPSRINLFIILWFKLNELIE